MWEGLPGRKEPLGGRGGPTCLKSSTAQCYQGTLSGHPPGNQIGGGGCLLPDNICIKNGQPVAEVLREKHPDMCVPPVEKLTCAAFKEYEDIPEMVRLKFTDDEVTWVTS